ncbi:exonuclease domain-containing protein [Vibrio breoganii]|uniref:exonuclease domain-containing protein n=1 Tax=Vibrio breoganii TaxID=553239 RepID=UPI000C85F624|nr:exonuclease domain-containing protein [Vibrio breoganii]PML10944.1 hypothetical protein BCT84_03525 [Vibrio breoganii]
MPFILSATPEFPSKSFSSLFMYDVETSGLEHAHSQITEFGAISCGMNLEERTRIEELVVPRADIIPAVEAYEVTKIDVDDQMQKGITERQLAEKVKSALGKGAVLAGYNNIAFDNTSIRHLFYRNNISVFEHERFALNSTLDVLQLVRMCYTYRPGILNFKLKEDGIKPCMKLESMCSANGIELTNAHAAMADIFATLELTKIIKQRAPDLFDFVLNWDKFRVVETAEMGCAVFYSAMFHSVNNRYTKCILPIHVTKNVIYAIDLAKNPSEVTEKDLIRLYPNKLPMLRAADQYAHACFKRFDLDAKTSEQHYHVAQQEMDKLKALATQHERENGFKKLEDLSLNERIYDFFSREEESLRRQLFKMESSEFTTENLGTSVDGSDSRVIELALCQNYLQRPELDAKTISEADRAILKKHLARVFSPSEQLTETEQKLNNIESSNRLSSVKRTLLKVKALHERNKAFYAEL